MRIRLIALALLFVPTTAAAQLETVVAGEVGRKLDRAVQTTSGGGLWGAVLVAKEGKVLLAKGYGYADYGSRPNTPASLFEIASVSKQFTGAAILKLVQSGKLELTTTLGALFKTVPKDKQAITVHELLTHTSGISPNVAISYASPLTREAAVRRFLRDPLASPRGKRFAYCNAAYSILAAIIEIKSGVSFEEYSRRELFTPAGMSDTGFVKDAHLDRKRATTRLSDHMPGTAVDWAWSWGYRGMGGAVSTLGDLLKWHQALRGTKVLDAQHKQLLFAPVKNGYACGWFVQATPRGTIRHQHSGGVAGYGANLVRYAKEDVVIAILSNGKSDMFKVTKALEAVVFPPPRVTLSLDVSPFKLSKWKAALLGLGASWQVKRAGNEVRLILIHTAKKRAVATITLPVGGAAALRRSLSATLKRKRPGKKGTPAQTESGLYLNGYRLRAGKLALEAGLTLRIMPRYVGTGAGGKRIVDERPTLVLTDTTSGQWPVMTHLNLPAARALLRDLDRVITK